MWAEGKVRIVDIARELGVSTATVSYVLHGKTGKVSPSTARRVQEKLQERGYIPNMAATLLAQNNSRITGIVINDHEKYEGQLLTDPFVSACLNALSQELDRRGLFMMIKKTRDILDAVPFASMWNMDGMVILGFCAAEYQALRNRVHIPFVVYDGYFENEGDICNLQLDDRDGGFQVGCHLRQLGHRRVLCVADNRACMDQRRYEGLCQGLEAPADFLLIPMLGQERESFYREHLAELRRHTAIFAVSDYYAAELMSFLQRAGISVPEEISVAGFDDGVLCRQLTPTLTSVCQHHDRRARQALDLLKQMRHAPSFGGDFPVPVRLIPRGSTGPARLCD